MSEMKFTALFDAVMSRLDTLESLVRAADTELQKLRENAAKSSGYDDSTMILDTLKELTHIFSKKEDSVATAVAEMQAHDYEREASEPASTDMAARLKTAEIEARTYKAKHAVAVRRIAALNDEAKTLSSEVAKLRERLLGVPGASHDLCRVTIQRLRLELEEATSHKRKRKRAKTPRGR